MEKKANEGMVLCDGYSKTSVGGKVSFPESATDEERALWQEMTDAEADELVLANTPPDDPEDDGEATMDDLYEALAKMGVE